MLQARVRLFGVTDFAYANRREISSVVGLQTLRHHANATLIEIVQSFAYQIVGAVRGQSDA